ncbi:hypothetical protein AVEN_154684-1 [Araneus ventricosus]|uniref:Uncharacterized protein n=1 Tax=Araneus ventricosus TaxID=182803 RepID=A0A4Y2E8E4_ARAVE|nr:hypothetical protein AVEN_154684-1 [Araneus ventricosus]
MKEGTLHSDSKKGQHIFSGQVGLYKIQWSGLIETGTAQGDESRGHQFSTSKRKAATFQDTLTLNVNLKWSGLIETGAHEDERGELMLTLRHNSKVPTFSGHILDFRNKSQGLVSIETGTAQGDERGDLSSPRPSTKVAIFSRHI